MVLYSLLVEISRLVDGNEKLLQNANQKEETFHGWRHMIAFIREFEEPTLAQRK